jgi:hypothetical protein
MYSMQIQVLGALLGATGGAAGGFLTSILELAGRRRWNRARLARGEALLRHETRPGMTSMGAILGAATGAPEFRPPDDVKQQFRGIEKAKKDR